MLRRLVAMLAEEHCALATVVKLDGRQIDVDVWR
jgi:hypothetical protein